MDCNHARLLLLMTRNSAELDATEAEALQAHLQHCGDCDAWAASERQSDDTLGKAMRDVTVPADLQSRILERLDHDRSRQRWRSVRVAAGLAAALLLAVAATAWLRGYWQRPVVDMAKVEQEIVKLGAKPEEVEEWFRDRGLVMEAPPLDFSMLYSYDVARFLNRRVPRLLFVTRGDQPANVAEVYVLPRSDFDVSKLEAEPPSPGSNHNIFTLPPNQHPDYLYLVVSTSASETPFMRGGNVR